MHIDGGYNYVYGLNVYDVICEDLVKNELSHRPMHLLYEHKSLMCKGTEKLPFFEWEFLYLHF